MAVQKFNKFKKLIILLATVSFITACGGRAANPIMVAQYGDPKKSCAALETEMLGIQQEISHLQPQADKTGKMLLWESRVSFL